MSNFFKEFSRKYKPKTPFSLSLVGMNGIAWMLCLNLLVANLVPNQDTHELSEVFTLVEHYHEHIESDHQDIGFLNFLLMHYADEEHQNAAGHEKLPFHHPQHSAVSGFFLALFPTTTISFPVGTWVSKPHLPYHSFFISTFVHSIWQPPKIG